MKIDLNIIHKTPDRPLYLQLKELLRDAIKSHVYTPGEKLESEREFIREGELSYPTVSRAFKELSDEGLLIRKVGAGTFVTTNRKILNATKLKKIAVFYYNTETPYFKELFTGVKNECAIHNIKAEPVASGFELDEELHIFENFKSRGFDGALGVPFMSVELCQELTKLLRQNFPISIIATYFRQLPCDAVTLDNENGGYMVMEHLWNLGHRKVCYLGNLPNYPFFMNPIEIMSGITRFLHERGIPEINFRKLLFPLRFDDKDPAVHRKILDFLTEDGKNRTTALICQGDKMACDSIKILARAGLRVPEDYSVVGFGDLPHGPGKPIDRPLTTIHWQLREAGRQAVRMLISRADFPDQIPVRLILSSHLVDRNTAGPVRR